MAYGELSHLTKEAVYLSSTVSFVVTTFSHQTTYDSAELFPIDVKALR